jgi:HK97 family phage major capsid protein
VSLEVCEVKELKNTLITPSDIIKMSQKYGTAVTKEIFAKEGFIAKENEEMKTVEKPLAQQGLITAVNNALRGHAIPQQFQNALTRTGDGAVLFPEELKGDIEQAKKYNKSMRQYVHVVPVKEKKGLYTTEDEGNFGELVEFGDGVPITEADMQFKGVNWNLKRYGSFTKVTEELFDDSGFDLTTTFVNGHSEKATKTENKLIFNAVRASLTPKALASVEALKTSVNKDFNPALENEIIIATNQDGLELFNKLDASGNPIKYFRTEGQQRYFDVYRFEVYSNEELPSLAGKAPFIYGSFNREVKLFTTETVETSVNKTGSGFLNAVYFLRGIEDYDVKVMPGATQLILGEIPIPV